MLPRFNPVDLAVRALGSAFVPTLAYFVLLRWLSVPWRRVPAALLHSVLGAVEHRFAQARGAPGKRSSGVLTGRVGGSGNPA
ncbi:MAG TPA: hypothetical protein VGU45_08170 [Microvirga sp.]|jgi:hypothetical protein|nr:hypothetical protein [Microvirga sp.]